MEVAQHSVKFSLVFKHRSGKGYTVTFTTHTHTHTHMIIQTLSQQQQQQRRESSDGNFMKVGAHHMLAGHSPLPPSLSFPQAGRHVIIYNWTSDKQYEVPKDPHPHPNLLPDLLYSIVYTFLLPVFCLGLWILFTDIAKKFNEGPSRVHQI